MRKIGDETGADATALVRRILALEAIFGADLPANEALAGTLSRHLAGLLLGDARDYLRSLLAAPVG